VPRRRRNAVALLESRLGRVFAQHGTRIAFSSSRTGPSDLFLKPSTGLGTEEALLKTPNAKVVQDWSKDGRFLLYYEVDPETRRDLWVLDMTANDRRTRVVVNTPFEESMAQFSPDGRWVAYQTNESGQFQVVVQEFPTLSHKWPVSTAGGVAPRWRADSQELYFIAPDGTLMAATIRVSGETVDYLAPVGLSAKRIVGGGAAPFNRPQYAV
jgi:Tol biopolymer transport system component